MARKWSSCRHIKFLVYVLICASFFDCGVPFSQMMVFCTNFPIDCYVLIVIFY